MLPFLPEAEPLVPRDSPRRIRDVENRDNLLAHAGDVRRAIDQEQRPRLRECRAMST